MARPLTGAEAFESLRTAQKSAYGAPAYSRWVNRPVGRVFAVGAYRGGMTPNQVTAVSAIFTALGIGALAFIRPSVGQGLAVAGLLLVGYALDSADGQLARLTGLGRSSGEWLDHTVDMAKICALHSAVLLSWWRWPPVGYESTVWTVAVPLGFLMVNVLAFFGWLLADLLMRLIRARHGAALALDRGPAPIARSLLRLPSDYGLLALLFVLWATAVYPALYAVLVVANALILVAALPTWFRQVRHEEEMYR